MIHTFSIELREAEGRNPELHGVILQEGRAAGERRELFTMNSVKWPREGVEIMPKHNGTIETRAHPIRSSDGVLEIRATATPALRAAVQAGRKHMSVEFFSLRENRTAGDIREITSAMVTGAALVPNPEYVQTSAELRSKQRRRVWL